MLVAAVLVAAAFELHMGGMAALGHPLWNIPAPISPVRCKAPCTGTIRGPYIVASAVAFVGFLLILHRPDSRPDTGHPAGVRR